MKDNPKISVIVPVYNVERYIDTCIASLCRQTYKNLEIILVDDGAADNSGKICDAYAKKDERIKVLHIENSGQSHARNEGLAYATGDFIGFVDGDDAAETNMYEILLQMLEKYDADIAECNFAGRKSKEPDIMEEGEIIQMTGQEALTRQLDVKSKSRFPSTSLWSKLFQKELIEDLRLPDGRIHEEYNYLCQALYKCRRYVYLNRPLYMRTLRGDSTTAEAFSERTFDKLAVYRQRNDFLKDIGEEKLLRLSKAQEYDLMLHYYSMACDNGMKEQIKQLKEEIKSCKQDIAESELPESRKKQYRLFFLNSRIYGILRKIKRRGSG